MTYTYVKAKCSLSVHDGYIRLDHCSFSQRRLFHFSHLLYSCTSSNYNRSRREKQRDAKLITHCNSDNENWNSVSVNGTCGQNECLLYRVPQQSLLVLLFYILYTKDLKKIAAKHGLSVLMYADDTQIYTSFTSENICQTKIKIENYLSEINDWMCQNYLKSKYN